VPELADHVRRLGPIAYLVTVGETFLPHVVAVRVALDDDGRFVLGAGRRSSANAEQRPDVTLLWSAPAGQDYSLIVDGRAEVADGGLVVTPAVAKLHRTPDGDPSAPSCITVLDTLAR
jgi:hypothetical protein